MIRLVDVTHHYGLRTVLRQVSLEVAEGEVLALMGPNGSGKSTLMQVMAGAIMPFRGHCEVDGKRRRSTEEAEQEIRRKTLYLPAEAYLPLSATAREWILAVGRTYQIDDLRLFDHVDRLLSLFDLVDKADGPIQGYSTGHRKKVALAGALITEAPIMLLDEPFAGGLDPAGIMAMRRVMQHLSRQTNTTIVMATPVPELVEEVADKIAILSEGRLVAHGTIDELRKLAGAARLDEAYQAIVAGGSKASIDNYFRGSP